MRPTFRIDATHGAARAGTLTLRRGVVPTPVFMPVATRGMVRLVPPAILHELGVSLLLANTYHLALRPGPDVVAALGGLSAFTGFGGPMLTDSGGFQVMSLGGKVDDDGVTFRSTYDGRRVRLTPESVVELEERFGVDIAMVLDVCTMLPAERAELEVAMARTTDWARRARAAHQDEAQALFGIVQGGSDVDLRRDHASAIADIGFDGYGIGGLAVGESAPATLAAVAAAIERLPADRPRYLMGVGDPYLISHAVELGVDAFDCVAPTRLARHGIALTSRGRRALRPSRLLVSDESVDDACDCSTCRTVPRGLIAHLLRVDAQSAGALLSIHNLAFQLKLLSDLREGIRTGTLERVLRRVDEVWAPSWRSARTEVTVDR